MLLVLSRSRQRKTSHDLREVLQCMNSRCEAEERYCSAPELRRRRDQPVKKAVAVLAELNESASQSIHDFRGALDVVEINDVNLE